MKIDTVFHIFAGERAKPAGIICAAAGGGMGGSHGKY